MADLQSVNELGTIGILVYLLGKEAFQLLAKKGNGQDKGEVILERVGSLDERFSDLKDNINSYTTELRQLFIETAALRIEMNLTRIQRERQEDKVNELSNTLERLLRGA